jgi:hypothetical protein
MSYAVGVSQAAKKSGRNRALARPDNGARFQPGNTASRGKGRPKGSKNKVPREFNELCKRLVSDPAYQLVVEQRAMDGELAPGLEAQIWDRGAGAVAKQVSVDVGPTLAELLAGVTKGGK